MNLIQQRQNEVKFIDYLKAQRVAYSQCKTYQVLDSVAIIMAISLPLIAIFNQELVNIFGAIGVLWTIFYLIAENFRKTKATQGAKIQEQFDTELFDLPWNDILCKAKINRDSQKELSNKYTGTDLEDWYSTEIDSHLPHELAVLLCQRINFSWELHLRKHFVRFLWITIVLYYGSFFIGTVLANMGMYDILVLLAPSLSFLIYGVQNSQALHSHITAKEEALDLIDGKIERYKRDEQLPNKYELRQIQDLIFTERTVPEKIPDWFYRLYRNKNETRTDELVKSIKNEL